MRILFIRHGIAVDAMRHSGDDFSRPLTEEGVEKTEDVSEAVAILFPDIKAIFSSQAARSRETADLIKESYRGIKVVCSAHLNPGATTEDFRKLLPEIEKAGDCIIVGHEPDFSIIISELLTGRLEILPIRIKKASCVEIDYSPTGSSLRNVIAPKILRQLGKKVRNTSVRSQSIRDK